MPRRRCNIHYFIARGSRNRGRRNTRTPAQPMVASIAISANPTRVPRRSTTSPARASHPCGLMLSPLCDPGRVRIVSRAALDVLHHDHGVGPGWNRCSGHDLDSLAGSDFAFKGRPGPHLAGDAMLTAALLARIAKPSRTERLAAG